MKLSTILNKIASCTVEFGPDETDKLHINYKPATYTPKFEAEVLTAAATGDKDALSCRLAPMLVSWDLTNTVTDEAGNVTEVPVATDQETLHGLPTMILTRALRAILEDMSPNRKTSDSSASG